MPTVFGTPRVEALAPAGTPPRNRLINRMTGVAYDWPVNHESEDAISTLGRRLNHGGKSPRIGTMRQPTHPGPIVLTLHGAMLDRTPATQYTKFLIFFGNCETTTFDYISAAGDSYEIAITAFDAVRKRSPAHVDGSYFTYSLSALVLSINSSPLSDYYA